MSGAADGNIIVIEADVFADVDVDKSHVVQQPDTGTSSTTLWFCYKLVLASLLAIIVCYTGLVFSCRTFRYEYRQSEDVVYYGFRGVTSGYTGRCVDWQSQNELEWNGERFVTLYILGITGFVLIVALTVSWMVYGFVLKSWRVQRDCQGGETLPPADASSVTKATVVVFGVMLIGAGCLMFYTIIAKCSNIPRLCQGNLGCDLWTWSYLAMIASILSCVVGCPLAFGVCCCCRCCCCKKYWRGQLTSY